MCLCGFRQQDVRATEIDKVDMYASFHPGDIVRALVVSFLEFIMLFSVLCDSIFGPLPEYSCILNIIVFYILRYGMNYFDSVTVLAVRFYSFPFLYHHLCFYDHTEESS